MLRSCLESPAAAGLFRPDLVFQAIESGLLVVFWRKNVKSNNVWCNLVFSQFFLKKVS